MVFYIEISSKFHKGNAEHEISVHNSTDECMYTHSVLHKCNSDEYDMIDLFKEDEDDNGMCNLFKCNSVDAAWLVFRFYENSVDAAFVFDQEADAKAKFESEASEVTPYDRELKVTEADDKGYEMCCTYVKHPGTYILPDKATRVVKVRLPDIEETIVI